MQNLFIVVGKKPTKKVEIINKKEKVTRRIYRRTKVKWKFNNGSLSSIYPRNGLSS